jgi:hypothetical protein
MRRHPSNSHPSRLADASSLSTRREFLSSVAGGLAIAGGLGPWSQSMAAGLHRAKKIRVAAVVTEFTYRSHAHVILENFLEPYLFNGRKVDPTAEFEIVSLYMDQIPKEGTDGRGEIGIEVAKEYKIPVCKTIAEALTLGTGSLAADAVLSIGEHGKYPVNALGQIEYPRKRFFDEIVAVFKKSGRVAPVFNDKHLSYRWDWAKEMVDTAARMNFPLMAGSSVPLATRRPPIELPIGVDLAGAVSIHGGGLESYDFHGLEVLQSMVEARKGAETGVSEVRFVPTEALWETAEAGLWSIALADAAIAADRGPGLPSLRQLLKTEPYASKPKPHGILITYRDGFRAMMLCMPNDGTHWSFAAQVVGETRPRATSYYVGPWDNRNLFKALSHAIQSHFRGHTPYPVERTLLTTGILETAMRSRRDGKALETPQLAIDYTPTDFSSFREMGDTWKILTPDLPQPKGIDHSGRSAS